MQYLKTSYAELDHAYKIRFTVNSMPRLLTVRGKDEVSALYIVKRLHPTSKIQTIQLEF